jgi:cell pole-organizing protein PopZ
VPGEALAALGGGAGQNAALEAAVLELLRPMLRQWLDQNMPRLVAEALKAEAARVRPSDNGTKA